MLSETVTALGGLKTAFDVAKALISAKSDSERLAAIADLQAALIDIQHQTLALQAAMAELQDEAITLRRSNETLQRRSTDLSRYQLVKFDETGAAAYRLRPEHVGGDEIDHYLCPNCYQKGEKSILQEDGRSLFCPSCAMRIYIRKQRPLRPSHRLV